MYISKVISNYTSSRDLFGIKRNIDSVELTLDHVDTVQLKKINDLYNSNTEVSLKENLTITPHAVDDAVDALTYCKRDVEVTMNYFKNCAESYLATLKVVKVIYNKPATIVFWSDDTKTVVKCDKKDKYDPEKGFYIACAKKLFGNNFKAVGKINKALKLAEDVNNKEK